VHQSTVVIFPLHS